VDLVVNTDSIEYTRVYLDRVAVARRGMMARRTSPNQLSSGCDAVVISFTDHYNALERVANELGVELHSLNLK